MRYAVGICLIVGLVLIPAGMLWAEGVRDASSADDVDIAQIAADQTMKTRVEFAEKCGISPAQLRYVMGAKGRLARIQRRLMQEAEALAVALGSETISDEEKQTVVEEYLELRTESLAQCRAIEAQIVETVGADENPLAMGALIILGAADSGKRPTCAIKSPVSGGAGTDVHGDPRGRENLRASFGVQQRQAFRPMKPRWRSWQ